ncbi:hypothetical protein E5D57_003494 [Metarhizium anisopliae]|nr:hypothetical protein E5D57_003494 [Metarhizium anisopliae]
MALLLDAVALAYWTGPRFKNSRDVKTAKTSTFLFASAIPGTPSGQITPHTGRFGAAGAAADKILRLLRAGHSDSRERAREKA